MDARIIGDCYSWVTMPCQKHSKMQEIVWNRIYVCAKLISLTFLRYTEMAVNTPAPSNIP